MDIMATEHKWIVLAKSNVLSLPNGQSLTLQSLQKAFRAPEDATCSLSGPWEGSGGQAAVVAWMPEILSLPLWRPGLGGPLNS